MTLSEVVSWARDNGRSLRKTSERIIAVEFGKTRLVGYGTHEVPGEITFSHRFYVGETEASLLRGVRLSDTCLIDETTWNCFIYHCFTNFDPKTREDLDALSEETSEFMEEFSKRRIEEFKRSKRQKIIEESKL